MAGIKAVRRLRVTKAICFVVVATHLISVGPAAAVTDSKRPTVTVTTPQDSVVLQQTPITPGSRVTGTAADDVSGIDYISFEYCQAIQTPSGWACGFLLSSSYGGFTNFSEHLRCRSKRRRCDWSLPLDGLDGPLVPGVYLFEVQVTDRAGRRSRWTTPLRIVVA